MSKPDGHVDGHSGLGLMAFRPGNQEEMAAKAEPAMTFRSLRSLGRTFDSPEAPLPRLQISSAITTRRCGDCSPEHFLSAKAVTTLIVLSTGSSVTAPSGFQTGRGTPGSMRTLRPA